MSIIRKKELTSWTLGLLFIFGGVLNTAWCSNQDGEPIKKQASVYVTSQTPTQDTSNFLPTDLSTLLSHYPLEKHEVVVRHYRQQVENIKGQARIIKSKCGDSMENEEVKAGTRAKVSELEEKLSLLKIVESEFGADTQKAKEQIQGKITQLEQKILENKEKGTQDSKMVKLYQLQNEEHERRLNALRSYLKVLGEDSTLIESELRAAIGYLERLEQERGAPEAFMSELHQKLSELRTLNTQYTRGPTGEEMLTQSLLNEVLLQLEVCQADIDCIDTQRLYQLFACTLELPTCVLTSGSSEPYHAQAKKLKDNLTYRNREDVFALGMGVHLLHDEVEDENSLFAIPKECELAKLKKPTGVFSEFNGSQVETLLKILKTHSGEMFSFGSYDMKLATYAKAFLKRYPSGLLGLYVDSIVTEPVSSFPMVDKPASHIYLQGVSKPEDIPPYLLKLFYSVIGRHINILVLDHFTAPEAQASLPSKESNPKIEDLYI